MGIDRESDIKIGPRESAVSGTFSIGRQPSREDIRESYRLYTRMYGIGMPDEKIRDAFRKRFPEHSAECINELIRLAMNTDINIAK